jgi:hypothetical protein
MYFAKCIAKGVVFFLIYNKRRGFVSSFYSVDNNAYYYKELFDLPNG